MYQCCEDFMQNSCGTRRKDPMFECFEENLKLKAFYQLLRSSQPSSGKIDNRCFSEKNRYEIDNRCFCEKKRSENHKKTDIRKQRELLLLQCMCASLEPLKEKLKKCKQNNETFDLRDQVTKQCLFAAIELIMKARCKAALLRKRNVRRVPQSNRNLQPCNQAPKASTSKPEMAEIKKACRFYASMAAKECHEKMMSSMLKSSSSSSCDAKKRGSRPSLAGSVRSLITRGSSSSLEHHYKLSNDHETNVFARQSRSRCKKSTPTSSRHNHSNTCLQEESLSKINTVCSSLAQSAKKASSHDLNRSRSCSPKCSTTRMKHKNSEHSVVKLKDSFPTQKAKPRCTGSISSFYAGCNLSTSSCEPKSSRHQSQDGRRSCLKVEQCALRRKLRRGAREKSMRQDKYETLCDLKRYLRQSTIDFKDTSRISRLHPNIRNCTTDKLICWCKKEEPTKRIRKEVQKNKSTLKSCPVQNSGSNISCRIPSCSNTKRTNLSDICRVDSKMQECSKECAKQVKNEEKVKCPKENTHKSRSKLMGCFGGNSDSDKSSCEAKYCQRHRQTLQTLQSCTRSNMQRCATNPCCPRKYYTNNSRKTCSKEKVRAADTECQPDRSTSCNSIQKILQQCKKSSKRCSELCSRKQSPKCQYPRWHCSESEYEARQLKRLPNSYRRADKITCKKMHCNKNDSKNALHNQSTTKNNYPTSARSHCSVCFEKTTNPTHSRSSSKTIANCVRNPCEKESYKQQGKSCSQTSCSKQTTTNQNISMNKCSLASRQVRADPKCYKAEKPISQQCSRQNSPDSKTRGAHILGHSSSILKECAKKNSEKSCEQSEYKKIQCSLKKNPLKSSSSISDPKVRKLVAKYCDNLEKNKPEREGCSKRKSKSDTSFDKNSGRNCPPSKHNSSEYMCSGTKQLRGGCDYQSISSEDKGHVSTNKPKSSFSTDTINSTRFRGRWFFRGRDTLVHQNFLPSKSSMKSPTRLKGFADRKCLRFNSKSEVNQENSFTRRFIHSSDLSTDDLLQQKLFFRRQTDRSKSPPSKDRNNTSAFNSRLSNLSGSFDWLKEVRKQLKRNRQKGGETTDTDQKSKKHDADKETSKNSDAEKVKFKDDNDDKGKSKKNDAEKVKFNDNGADKGKSKKNDAEKVKFNDDGADNAKSGDCNTCCNPCAAPCCPCPSRKNKCCTNLSKLGNCCCKNNCGSCNSGPCSSPYNCGPCAPACNCGPCMPVCNILPCMPVCNCGPCAPASNCGPCAPTSNCGPCPQTSNCGPCAPACNCGPCSPACNCGPCSPACNCGPCTPACNCGPCTPACNCGPCTPACNCGPCTQICNCSPCSPACNFCSCQKVLCVESGPSLCLKTKPCVQTQIMQENCCPCQKVVCVESCPRQKLVCVDSCPCQKLLCVDSCPRQKLLCAESCPCQKYLCAESCLCETLPCGLQENCCPTQKLICAESCPCSSKKRKSCTFIDTDCGKLACTLKDDCCNTQQLLCAESCPCPSKKRRSCTLLNTECEMRECALKEDCYPPKKLLCAESCPCPSKRRKSCTLLNTDCIAQTVACSLQEDCCKAQKLLCVESCPCPSKKSKSCTLLNTDCGTLACELQEDCCTPQKLLCAESCPCPPKEEFQCTVLNTQCAESCPCPSNKKMPCTYLNTRCAESCPCPPNKEIPCTYLNTRCAESCPCPCNKKIPCTYLNTRCGTRPCCWQTEMVQENSCPSLMSDISLTKVYKDLLVYLRPDLLSDNEKPCKEVCKKRKKYTVRKQAAKCENISEREPQKIMFCVLPQPNQPHCHRRAKRRGRPRPKAVSLDRGAGPKPLAGCYNSICPRSPGFVSEPEVRFSNFYEELANRRPYKAKSRQYTRRSHSACCGERKVRVNYLSPARWASLKSKLRTPKNPKPLPKDFILDTRVSCPDVEVQRCREKKRQLQLEQWQNDLQLKHLESDPYYCAEMQTSAVGEQPGSEAYYVCRPVNAGSSCDGGCVYECCYCPGPQTPMPQTECNSKLLVKCANNMTVSSNMQPNAACTFSPAPIYFAQANDSINCRDSMEGRIQGCRCMSNSPERPCDCMRLQYSSSESVKSNCRCNDQCYKPPKKKNKDSLTKRRDSIKCSKYERSDSFTDGCNKSMSAKKEKRGSCRCDCKCRSSKKEIKSEGEKVVVVGKSSCCPSTTNEHSKQKKPCRIPSQPKCTCPCKKDSQSSSTSVPDEKSQSSTNYEQSKSSISENKGQNTSVKKQKPIHFESTEECAQESDTSKRACRQGCDCEACRSTAMKLNADRQRMGRMRCCRYPYGSDLHCKCSLCNNGCCPFNVIEKEFTCFQQNAPKTNLVDDQKFEITSNQQECYSDITNDSFTCMHDKQLNQENSWCCSEGSFNSFNETESTKNNDNKDANKDAKKDANKDVKKDANKETSPANPNTQLNLIRDNCYRADCVKSKEPNSSSTNNDKCLYLWLPKCNSNCEEIDKNTEKIGTSEGSFIQVVKVKSDELGFLPDSCEQERQCGGTTQCAMSCRSDNVKPKKKRKKHAGRSKSIAKQVFCYKVKCQQEEPHQKKSFKNEKNTRELLVRACQFQSKNGQTPGPVKIKICKSMRPMEENNLSKGMTSKNAYKNN